MKYIRNYDTMEGRMCFIFVGNCFANERERLPPGCWKSAIFVLDIWIVTCCIIFFGICKKLQVKLISLPAGVKSAHLPLDPPDPLPAGSCTLKSAKVSRIFDFKKSLRLPLISKIQKYFDRLLICIISRRERLFAVFLSRLILSYLFANWSDNVEAKL